MGFAFDALNLQLFIFYFHSDEIFIKKMCRVFARRLSIYNFVWELLKATNLQAESKILKKILEHQIYQSKPKISKKETVFRTLKVERGQKYAGTEFSSPT
jgi:hypothetical protein